MAKRKPQRALILWGFLVRYGELFRLGCCYLFIPVQPFAYVVANYACYNRDKKSENKICHVAFTSFLLEVRQLLHHIILHANILHNSCCNVAMAAITRAAGGRYLDHLLLLCAVSILSIIINLAFQCCYVLHKPARYRGTHAASILSD